MTISIQCIVSWWVAACFELWNKSLVGFLRKNSVQIKVKKCVKGKRLAFLRQISIISDTDDVRSNVFFLILNVREDCYKEGKYEHNDDCHATTHAAEARFTIVANNLKSEFWQWCEFGTNPLQVVRGQTLTVVHTMLRMLWHPPSWRRFKEWSLFRSSFRQSPSFPPCATFQSVSKVLWAT